MYEHSHHAESAVGGRALKRALVLTPGFAVVEFVVGWWGGSLARINAMLLKQFNVDYPTLQPELAPGQSCLNVDPHCHG